ncbi:MAG: glycosyltransferase family 4 protein [Bacteroidota bacterium]
MKSLSAIGVFKLNITTFIHPSRTLTPCSGVGRHMNNLLLAMHQLQEVDLSLLFARQWLDGSKRLPVNTPLRNLPYTTFLFPERLIERSWKSFGLPTMDFWLKDSDWIFAPMETHFPTRKVKTAFTLHDIQAYEEDLPWSGGVVHQKFRRRWSLWIYKAVKEADLVFTVSEFSRRRIIELLDLPESKVKISGNAVDPVFLIQVNQVSPKKVDYPYLAVIGGLRPKKGGHEILRLAERLEKEGSELKIITWGENDPELLVKARSNKNITCLGMIPDEEMISWLKGAHATLFLSWYEGFGLPVLEAMACGSPVICSRLASLPEVAGDAAMLVHPEDAEAILDWITKLEDENIRKEWVKKGMKRVGAFSWEQAANHVITAFKAFG